MILFSLVLWIQSLVFSERGVAIWSRKPKNAENWIELKRVRERSEGSWSVLGHYASFWPATSINFVGGFVKFLDADPLS